MVLNIVSSVIIISKNQSDSHLLFPLKANERLWGGEVFILYFHYIPKQLLLPHEMRKRTYLIRSCDILWCTVRIK